MPKPASISASEFRILCQLSPTGRLSRLAARLHRTPTPSEALSFERSFQQSVLDHNTGVAASRSGLRGPHPLQ